MMSDEVANALCGVAVAAMIERGIPEAQAVLFGERACRPLGRVARKAVRAGAKVAKKKIKRSSWHKYMKQPKNQIKFKSGSKKGLLNMKAMSRAYKRSRK